MTFPIDLDRHGKHWQVVVLGALLGVGIGCSHGDISVRSPKTPAAKSFRKPEPPPAIVSPASQVEAIRVVQGTLQSLQQFHHAGRPYDRQQVSFEFPEFAINEYLASSLKSLPRPGVDQARVKLLDRNHLVASIVLNFDRLSDWAPTMPALLKPLLSTTRRVDLDISFQVQDAALTLQFGDPSGVEGGAMLRRVIESLVHIVALHQPEHYDTDQPIPLPFGLRKLWTKAGIVGGET